MREDKHLSAWILGFTLAAPGCVFSLLWILVILVQIPAFWLLIGLAGILAILAKLRGFKITLKVFAGILAAVVGLAVLVFSVLSLMS